MIMIHRRDVTGDLHPSVFEGHMSCLFCLYEIPDSAHKAHPTSVRLSRFS